MRILYLTAPADVDKVGGIQRYEQDVGAAIAARGHDVRWLHCRPREALADLSLRDRIPSPGFWKPFYFWRRYYLEDFRFHQRVARRVREECAAFRPDLVHSFHVYNLGALAAPCPVSVTCHGLEIQNVPPVSRMLERASGVHAVSGFTAGFARRVQPGLTPTVLSWGVRAQEISATKKDYDLITVGRLVRRKNVETVLQALTHLPPLRYVIVGDGPERAALQALASSLQLRNVDFVGEVSDELLHELFDRSRLFVMVPRASDDDFEGLGLVYYEAHGHGLPVIASNGAGVPDAVGQGGILVDRPNDPAALARTIESALAPERFDELRSLVDARRRSHGWDRFIDSFERWHGTIVSGRG